jgi:hypothetical protein
MQSMATTVEEYIAELPDERRPVFEKLHAVIVNAIPALEPHMLSGMIGYGTYHYTYASGREGDWSVVALANQKNYVSVYICAADEHGYLAENNKERLGSVSVGRSCIRFKKLGDIDLDVLSELCKKAEEFARDGKFTM